MNDKEARDALKRVIAIIEAENVPGDLRPTAFDHIWSAITGSTAAASAAGAGEPHPAGEDTDRVAAFAARLRVDPRAVEDAFDVLDDGSFAVQVPTNSLAEKQQPGTIQIALLVCASRQFGGEDRTPATAIREVCDRYGKLDAPNFAKTMRKSDKFWNISAGRLKTYKLRNPGWDEAGRLAGELAGK